MIKYIIIGFLLGYGFSFVSAEWYQFWHLKFIKLCRWAELPHEVWAFMDQYIFFGAL